jgi:MoaA/NifB/PqqE/SkfB family radical SAM enzyme
MINTNGYSLTDFADFLIEQKVDSVTVSIDGMDAEMHDNIRGKQGSFDRAMEGLRYLKENRLNGLPFTSIRGVIMKNNFSMMDGYISRFKGTVDDIKFQPVHDYEGFNQVVDKATLFSEKDAHLEAEFSEVLTSVMKKEPIYNHFYYKNFPKFLFHPEKMETQSLNHCLPVWMNFMIIMEDGSCRSCSKVIGNIYDHDVETIWNGEKRLGFLRSLAQFGKCKVPCWQNCTGVAHAWQGKILKSMLKVGSVSDETWEDFKQSPNYTGLNNETVSVP